MPADPIDDPNDTAPADASAASPRADLAVRRALVADQPRFLGFLIRRLRDRDTAGEVFQRFVLHALERSGDIRDSGAVHGWLGRVLASTLADHYRRAHRMQRNERAVREADLARPITNLEQDDTAAACVCLHLLLPGLRPAYAELLRRVDLEGEPRARGGAASHRHQQLERAPASRASGPAPAADGVLPDLPRRRLPRVPMRGGEPPVKPPTLRAECV